MGHGHPLLLRNDGAGHGGGDIAHDQAQIAGRFPQKPLITDHDAGRLLGLGSRADLEVHVGRGDSQLLEEVSGHARVVVLACVDKAETQGSTPDFRAPSALMIGAIFMKFGRAPAMMSMTAALTPSPPVPAAPRC